MDMLRVACIQMNSTDQLSANLLHAEELLQQAAAKGSRLALLPENFAFMGANDAAKRHAAQAEGESHVLDFLARQAAKSAMAIIGGSVLLKGEDGQLRNSCVAFSATGERLALYDKMHLFDVDLDGDSYRESDLIQPGDTPQTAVVDDWKIGLSICYDLRFPELYRHYSAAGCELFCVPSAFTVPTGKAHWETLLRARAIENQCYLLAAAQCGVHPGGRSTWGHSMIVDPWGEVQASAGEGECVIVADISKPRLRGIRRQFPALRHRRNIV